MAWAYKKKPIFISFDLVESNYEQKVSNICLYAYVKYLAHLSIYLTCTFVYGCILRHLVNVFLYIYCNLYAILHLVINNLNHEA